MGADGSLNSVLVGKGNGMATQGGAASPLMLQCQSLAYICLVWL
jgi:hypothetical protein